MGAIPGMGTGLKDSAPLSIVPASSGESFVPYFLGKFLELNGMVILALGLFWGLARDDVRVEIGMLLAGVAIFLVGYWIERKVSRRR
jgi:hypothetical protein